MKRIVFMGLFLSGALLFSSCDLGWAGNKKEAVRKVLKDNFVKGLESSGVSMPDEVVDGWVDCVSEKIFKEYKSFEEFKEHQTDPKVNGFMKECEEEHLDPYIESL
jgi:hypothetical protein